MENFVFPITSMLIVAALTEACLETTKGFISVTISQSGNKILAFAIATILSFALNVSVFNSTGIIYCLGVILSATIISRGANYIHDLATVLEGIASTKKIGK